LALSFARHTQQGDTLISHNERINALFDSIATSTGTDDQLASEVPYTNNSQTTTEEALDSLFSRDVVLGAQITSLDGRVTTLEGDVSLINDSLVAHNNRLIVLENKPDTILKQGVDQFTFSADILSLSLSDTNQVVQVTIPISTIDTIVDAFIFQDTIVRIETNNDLFSIPVRVKKTILPLLYPIQDSISSYANRIDQAETDIETNNTQILINESDIAILQSGLALVTIQSDNNEDSLIVHRTDINTLFSLLGNITTTPDDSILTLSSVDTILSLTTADGNIYKDTLRLTDIPILYDSLSDQRVDIDSILNILGNSGPSAPGDSITSFITVSDSTIRIATHDGNIYNTTVGFTKYINIVLDSVASHLARIELAETNIKNLQMAVAVNTGDIAENLDSIQAHNTRINNNVDNIATNTGDISQNATDIVEVNDSLTNIRADVGANLDSIFNHRGVLNSILSTLVIHEDSLTQHGLDISSLYTLVYAIVADSTTSFSAEDSVLTLTTYDGNVFKDTLRLSELTRAFDSLTVHRTDINNLLSQDVFNEVADSIVTFEVIADSTLRITSFDGSTYDATVGFTKYINRIYDSLAVHWTQISANGDSISTNKDRIIANEIDIAVAQSAIALNTLDIADLFDTTIVHNIRLNQLFDTTAQHRIDLDSLFRRNHIIDVRLSSDRDTLITESKDVIWREPVGYLTLDTVIEYSSGAGNEYYNLYAASKRYDEVNVQVSMSASSVTDTVYLTIPTIDETVLTREWNFNMSAGYLGRVILQIEDVGPLDTNSEFIVSYGAHEDLDDNSVFGVLTDSITFENVTSLELEPYASYHLNRGWENGAGLGQQAWIMTSPFAYSKNIQYYANDQKNVEGALDSLFKQQDKNVDSLTRHRIEIDSMFASAVNYMTLDTFFTNTGGTIDLRPLCKQYDLIRIQHRMLEVDVDSQITYILLSPDDPDMRVKRIEYNGRDYNGRDDAFVFDVEGATEL